VNGLYYINHVSASRAFQSSSSSDSFQWHCHLSPDYRIFYYLHEYWMFTLCSKYESNLTKALCLESKPNFSNSYTGDGTLDIPLQIPVSISPSIPRTPFQEYTR
jgi:hypothetical protein